MANEINAANAANSAKIQAEASKTTFDKIKDTAKGVAIGGTTGATVSGGGLKVLASLLGKGASKEAIKFFAKAGAVLGGVFGGAVTAMASEVVDPQELGDGTLEGNLDENGLPKVTPEWQAYLDQQASKKPE